MNQFIIAKRDGKEHSADEINAFVQAVVSGGIPEYQASAWLMAAFLNGLTSEETYALTMAMRDSGDPLEASAALPNSLDKHSTGGVGDKTSLVVIPILAACGVPVLKMSGRGLGFSGGTIDKLEAIPGFRTNLSPQQAMEQTQRIGAAIIGQSTKLAPADQKLYALRDVTGTVESTPLIVASIMSKKLAAGASSLLLDVKVGRGSFVPTREKAMELAKALALVGKKAGIRTQAILSDMDEPLGWAVGNANEVVEAAIMLTGRGRIDLRFRDLCVTLASRGVLLSGRASSIDEAYTMAEKALDSGAAAEKFQEIIRAQGGDGSIVEQPEMLARASTAVRVRSQSSGYVHGIAADRIGWLAVKMGAGRSKKGDTIDHMVGIELHKKTGDSVDRGDVLADLLLRNDIQSHAFSEELKACFEIGGDMPLPKSLFLGLVDSKDIPE